MGAKNRRDVKEYSGVILHCSHLEPLDSKGVYLYLNRDRDGRNEKNYASIHDIAEELKNVGLENFLDFNANDDFEIAKCEGCGRPLLGYLEVKCGVKQEVRYGSELVKDFENWLKRIPGFREALNTRT